MSCFPPPCGPIVPDLQQALLTVDLYGQASRGLWPSLPQLAEVLKASDSLTFAPSCCHFESYRPEGCIPLRIYFPSRPPPPFTPLPVSLPAPPAPTVEVFGSVWNICKGPASSPGSQEDRQGLLEQVTAAEVKAAEAAASVGAPSHPQVHEF